MLNVQHIVHESLINVYENVINMPNPTVLQVNRLAKISVSIW